MFGIPEKGEVREKWVEFLVLLGKTVHKNVNYRICEHHFEPEEILMRKNRKMLVPGAVPSCLFVEVRNDIRVTFKN